MRITCYIKIKIRRLTKSSSDFLLYSSRKFTSPAKLWRNRIGGGKDSQYVGDTLICYL